MIRQNIELTVSDSSLSCILTQPDHQSTQAVILLHPHPLYGGTKDDQVVKVLDTVFLRLGYMTLRFDFRGVFGGYAGLAGAVEDTLKAMEIVEEYEPLTLGLAGYSFGGSVALRVASLKSVSFLVILSASLDLFLEDDYDLLSLHRIKCPVLVFHGDRDDLIPHHDMKTLASLIADVKAISLEHEDHFYQYTMFRVIDEIRLFVSRLPPQKGILK